MFAEPKPSRFYAGCNDALLRAVPPAALRILDVGCGTGALGARLKALEPRRTVLGIERQPDAAARAAERLDHVFPLDVQSQDPPVEPGSLDAILYGDVLEHLLDPEDVLARHRRLLRPDGVLLASVPNAQHHFLVRALLRGDLQYTSSGLLDATHLLFFTYATLLKLLLNAGYAPEIVEAVAAPCPAPFLEAAAPLLRHLGLDPNRTQRYLGAYQYVVRGTPLPYYAAPEADAGAAPLSIVVCVSDEAILQANLLASPCLGPGSPHEVLTLPGCPSAAEGLRQGRARARHALLVWAHQDVYLPRGWPARFQEQYRRAEAALGPVGVAGVYGVSCPGGRPTRAGFVVDRDRLLREPPGLPARVDTLDELLLAVRRAGPLGFDPRLGWHFYGADVCLAARELGLAAVAVDALCYHNSPHAGLPEAFVASAEVFAAKWARHLPVATSCALIDKQGRVQAI
jgi:SAM-dependent methyltransferase